MYTHDRETVNENRFKINTLYTSKLMYDLVDETYRLDEMKIYLESEGWISKAKEVITEEKRLHFPQVIQGPYADS